MPFYKAKTQIEQLQLHMKLAEEELKVVKQQPNTTTKTKIFCKAREYQCGDTAIDKAAASY